ncbi:hypothetical protein OE88DRAFT_1652098 [Heliocybe sulcata]|uniref:UBC core domain-containing protein n=1 Tax=Heliocybe sulcata TaxID=5364 RepID=A0A5C3NFH9_9AGAM|nr:hypothetical protein OE88DRAFT_1652098 [Heliocybe sulcata]
MQAAEQIFDGKFDHIMEENGNADAVPTREIAKRVQRPATPEDEEDGEEDEEDDMDGFADYDSDDDFRAEPGKPLADVDPYAGIFFSKDRREEVIEVEEEPDSDYIPQWDEKRKLMTQGEWMKGCPEGSEQSFLFSLYSQLSEGQCPCPHGCGEGVQRKKSDFFVVPPNFNKYVERLRKLVLRDCNKCKKQFCLACGEPISATGARESSTTSDDPLFHCSNLQGVVLGVGLFLVEQMYSDQIQEGKTEQNGSAGNSKKRKSDTQPPPPLTNSFDDDDDVYYGTSSVKAKKLKSGTGYAGNVKEDTSGQLEALDLQRARDEKLGHLMTAVRWYLPSLRRSGGGRTSDYLVHPTALAHLRRRFNHICSALLKNDSLSDMSDRSVLYHELFDWLETIAHHEALASMMAMPIMVVASVKGVSTRKGSNNHPIRERTIVYEGSSGPRELLESLVIQAQAAMKSLEKHRKAPESEEEELTEEAKRVTNESKGKGKEPDMPEDSRKLHGFCKRILATADAIDRFLSETKGAAFVERLHASLPKISTSSKEAVHVASGATEEATRDIYVDWATQTRFEYCDLSVPPADSEEDAEDQTPSYMFYFNNEARMLANSDIPKRSLAIAKELAVLTTNLPVAWDSSIFSRVDETRVDIIKALITGPAGTPYHNGCFLFDIFLGPSYNQSPPSVKYMTTNGGKYRFNPNLYADGKVCLSLLGTWSGPGWVSGKSTLLQVLISIQSMILCEEPYLNEPGWASSAGTAASQAYSANVRRMVVKTAMLGNLKTPPEPFADIIRTHFRLKANPISQQLDEWLAQDDGRAIAADGASYNTTKATGAAAGTSDNGLRSDVEEMKRMLTQLQNEGASGSGSTS